MQELEIVNAFYKKASTSDFSSYAVEEILREDFYHLSPENKSAYLTCLLNGLMQFDISIDIIVALYKCLMKLDGYDRGIKPKADAKDCIVLECTGSGKKPNKTLNISTPSILTAVTAGAKIIKKGSSATSSVIGSADLIYGLGLNPYMTIKQQEQLLYGTGFTFINIEQVIPIFNSIYNGHFYNPHALSLVLAADVTSLRGDKIVYGLSGSHINESCQALTVLDSATDITVYTSTEDGENYYDEIIGNGTCHVARRILSSSSIELSQFDCNTTSPHKIKAMDSQEKSIGSVLDLLKNHSNSLYVDIICRNAAFYLKEAGIVESIKDGFVLSKEVLCSGKVYEKLLEIIDFSGGVPTWYKDKKYGYIHC